MVHLYNDVPYHNAWHGFSVLHISYMFIQQTRARDILDPLDVFALLTASFGHDIGHTGFNNAFHNALLYKDEFIPNLSVTYNDQSGAS